MAYILGKYPENELIREERDKATFPVRELTYHIEGSEDKSLKRKELGKSLI